MALGSTPENRAHNGFLASLRKPMELEFSSGALPPLRFSKNNPLETQRLSQESLAYAAKLNQCGPIATELRSWSVWLSSRGVPHAGSMGIGLLALHHEHEALT